MQKNKYAIIDFGANYRYTHHKDFILSYANFLKARNYYTTIFLPIQSKLKFINHEVSYELITTYHHQKINWYSIRSLHEVILAKIQNSIPRIQNMRIKKMLSRLILNYYAKKIEKRIEKLLENYSVFIFPTLCPPTIAAVMRLAPKFPSIQFKGRLTNTAENLEVFRTLEIKSILRKIPENFTVGFETLEYFKIMNPEKEIKKFIHVPVPTDIKELKNEKNIRHAKLVISILGKPRAHKGQGIKFDLISNVNKFIGDRIFWNIQDKNISKINYSSNICYHGETLDEEKLDLIISQSDLILLPYEVQWYKANASAMVYKICNFKIPLLTFTGSAFANELKEFSAVYDVDGVSGIVKVIENFDELKKSTMMANIMEYNNYRTRCNEKFLGI